MKTISDERREEARNLASFANSKIPTNSWYAKATSKGTIELGDRGVGGCYKIEIDEKGKAKYILPASNLTLTPDQFDTALKVMEDTVKCMKDLQEVNKALKKAKLVK
jgi:hypothetical protein